jgi:5'-nucleotidase
VFVVLIHRRPLQGQIRPAGLRRSERPITDVVKRLDPAIRLVITGHSHEGYLCKVDGRAVTQADMGGHVLSRIKLSVDTQTNSVRDVSARQEVMVPGTWPADPALDAYLVKARERSTAALAQPIATLAVPSVKREKDHARESALGDLVADSMLNAGRPFGAQIALQNPGGIRQDLETASGNRVTLGHAMAVLPFGNSLVAMNLRGAQIVDLLEEQWAGGRDAKRGLLQVSEGFWYEWDPAQPKAAGSCRAA